MLSKKSKKQLKKLPSQIQSKCSKFIKDYQSTQNLKSLGSKYDLSVIHKNNNLYRVKIDYRYRIIVDITTQTVEQILPREKVNYYSF